ncbi:uncharacterized protein isoform X2 [Danio rerio]|uniref:Uncharacterized protein isoform X2 n=1 Tax=Danio rerio TaxID=7955 RepID=A0AC58IMU0_DANRE
MRILQSVFILSAVLSCAWISAAGETLTVSVYYPSGYIWVSPYQAIPVLTHYVIPVPLKTTGSERTTTPRPILTTTQKPAPPGPVTSEPPTVTPATPTVSPPGPVSTATPTVSPAGPVSTATPTVSPPGPVITATPNVTSEPPTTATRRGDN